MVSREEVLSAQACEDVPIHKPMQRLRPRGCVSRHRACPPSERHLGPQGRGLMGEGPETSLVHAFCAGPFIFSERWRSGSKGTK